MALQTIQHQEGCLELSSREEASRRTILETILRPSLNLIRHPSHLNFSEPQYPFSKDVLLHPTP